MNMAIVYIGGEDGSGAIVHVLGLSALDTLARLHALAPTLDLVVLELEEETVWGSPRWTKVDWRYVPRAARVPEARS